MRIAFYTVGCLARAIYMSSADSAFAGMKEWFKYAANRTDLIKRRVNKALALPPRGGVAKDILLLK
ncbi:MAG TPA: hypothetical protein VKJ45_25775, partial [Blastocatellia bacterium]|nr:hypothetical protein [Blastocatellia bacterium]